MLESKYEWQLAKAANPEQVTQLTDALDVSPFMARLLAARGLTNPTQAKQWLQPTAEALHDPSTMFDMQKGIERIQLAVGNGDLITVYGDYDADGLTSTSLMYETLDQLGANVNYYIPNRFDDGYGPNVAAFNRLIDSGTQLFVTVDNGVAGHEAISAAKARGVDVVVTDHHELPDELPDAAAIIHPRHPKGNYPFGGLSGVGVAFKVAQGLLEASVDELSDELDLVAIGEIADLVPLDDENHTLVKFGLQVIENTQRPGLLALMKAAGVDASAVTEETVGFGIAPRLNALGRLGDANPAVELLTTFDEDRAEELAKTINGKNDERQQLVKQISETALAQAQTPENSARHTLIIYGKDWHEGVLGIVASKIVEATHKPTLVLSENTEKQTLKGSGRSVAGYDLFKAITPISDQLIAFGGHAMACGLTVGKAALTTLADALEQACLDQDVDLTKRPVMPVAATISLAEINAADYDAIHQLGPFGTDNPQPVFEVQPATVTDIKTMGAAKNHLKFTLQDDDQNHVPAIAFGHGEDFEQVSANPDDVAVIGTLSTNKWQGKTTYQLMLKDLRVSGVAIVDGRTNNLAKTLFTAPATYLFFHDQIAKQLADYLPDNAKTIQVGKDDLPTTIDHLIIVDCPDDLAVLEQVLQQITVNELTVYFYERESAYLSGMPSRAEYGKLFKFVATHHDVDVAHQLPTLADYLQIDRDKLIFMIQLFFEVGFVKMEAGVMNGEQQPPHAELTTAAAYHERLTRIDTEEKLLYSKTPQLKQWLLGAMSKA
ncbi:single-stranded-DNA-specific exonuclease RecJ [Furfurilactobacillus siliginis]|uniref:Single-stranded-DNA-specific exonuclease RecJ n=1 Tax=Furfurilactobacillus siliginis TaxID=348151 RepID=A0A510VTQ3_9LACO|nr:single-stranded-DNA-specific exonuclease RecJ [Furfurilactobacillus siliginis]GEK28180.1 single-stranded-DNA-specific exonuclease RecJ [Furfurilactobacillus siliginis]